MGGRNFEIFLFFLHVDPPMAQTRPWASIRVWLGRLNLFWPFGPSFPFILAFWAFISFHFGLLGLHFFSFWPFGPSFLHFWLVWAATWGPPHKLPKTVRFPFVPYKECSSARPGFILVIFSFGKAHLSYFWPFLYLEKQILAIFVPREAHFDHFCPCRNIFAQFLLLCFHFLSFLPFGLSFPFLGCHAGSPPQVAKNGPFSLCPI